MTLEQEQELDARILDALDRMKFEKDRNRSFHIRPAFYGGPVFVLTQTERSTATGAEMSVSATYKPPANLWDATAADREALRGLVGAIIYQLTSVMDRTK